ncbi:hemolysin-III family protein [Fusarium venenatum]|uniref:hemolysin-III family protein n=1 Tax=Fusarium venenatum TaxID=56646 RepID=UPI001D544EE4|nr:hemolysin-III family protein [Fusarium venenatum]
MSPRPRFRVSPSKSFEAQKRQEIESVGATSFGVGEVARPDLCSLHQMPVWFQLQSNPWILHSYMPISGSTLASAGSLSYIHNESVNIYSHLIPAVLFMLGGWHMEHYLASEYPKLTSADSTALFIFMLAAFACLSLSTTYHTLMNHSQRVEHLCLQLDMLGIVILISGDHVLGIYVIFWCEAWLRYVHWCMVGVFGIITVIVTLNPKLQGPKYRLLRALSFVAAGMSGVAPLIHGISVFGMAQTIKKVLPYALVKAACLVSGTFLYAVSSHSIFHILVVFAAVVQLIGYLDALDYAHTNLICSSR